MLVRSRTASALLALVVFAGLAGTMGTPLAAAADPSASPALADATPDPASAAPSDQPTATPAPSADPEPTATAEPTPTLAPPPPPSETTRLRLIRTIYGTIMPKSVVASGTGLVIANNMMYRHSMTVYNAAGRLVRTISDRVVLARLGWGRWTRPVLGSPVEAAFSPDGATAYVSQYAMYGPGFAKPGWDTASPADGTDRGFIYRVDMATGRITGAARVGSLPKAVSVSPDGRWLVVGNWNSWDVSVVDLATFREVRRLKGFGNPRGLAWSPDGTTLWISSEWHNGGHYPAELSRVTVATWRVARVRSDLGNAPRHLVMSPDGRWLYASLTGSVTNISDRVIRINAANGRVVGSVRTCAAPRTIALAPDARSLYVTCYDARLLAKVDVSGTVMRVTQRLKTKPLPVGVTVEPTTGNVWVANYSGSIQIFREED